MTPNGPVLDTNLRRIGQIANVSQPLVYHLMRPWSAVMRTSCAKSVDPAGRDG